MTQPAWLEHAWRELGEEERSGGAAHNARILALYRDAGHPEITADEVAWCAAFAGASLERAGVRCTRSLLARSYLEWGAPLHEPRLGAIAVFSRSSDPSLGHVGFWIGEAGNDIVLLGGNQSNAVTVTPMPKARLLGLRWPSLTAAAPSAGELSSAQSVSASSNFAVALAHVLDMEGDFSDDPYDTGGPTNFGITLAEYASWNGTTLDEANRDALKSALKRISLETVGEIYQQRYWAAAHCSALPAGLALMHFDAAVNHGVGTATRCLQEAVKATIDGEMGPETQAAAVRAPELEALESYAAIRRRRYRALATFWRFGRGWLARVDTTLTRAKAQIARTDNDTSLNTSEGETTMTNPTISSADAKWWGHSMTIWGTLITALSAVVPVLVPALGLDISSRLIDDLGTQMPAAVQAITALIGTLVTIFGRVRATQPLEQRSISFRL
ncbi:MAG: TIGR02594 family protein [Hyphomicrobium sp.]|jgi:uncharacterized protein (TIGR02594 family)